MRCPFSVKNRMLLAEVAPMSRTQSGSSDLNRRESSAIALERRVSRCVVLGAGASAGVLRKNLMMCEVVADTPAARPGVEALQTRKPSNAQYTRIAQQRP